MHGELNIADDDFQPFEWILRDLFVQLFKVWLHHINIDRRAFLISY